MSDSYDVFYLSPEQRKTLDSFIYTQNMKSISYQKGTIDKNHPDFLSYKTCWDMNVPYAGPVDALLTFEFTPTSVGVIIKARHNITNNTIDLTEWSKW